MPPTVYGQKSGRAFNPTIIFIYGGTWGSGDKSMYGLLCTQLANRMNATVICPNYSTYPKVSLYLLTFYKYIDQQELHYRYNSLTYFSNYCNKQRVYR